MAGARWAQKLQMGREATAGTAVAASTIWRGPASMLHDRTKPEIVEEDIGLAVPTLRTYMSEVDAGLTMPATPATFEQIPHIFEAGIKSVGTGAADGGGTGKVYAYPVGITSVNTVKTYTLESGDNQQAEEAAYCFVERFTLTAEPRRPVMTSAEWRGRQVSDTTFTTGLALPVVEEILGRASLYIDPVSGNFGSTAVSSTLLGMTLSVRTGWRPKFTMDSGQLYFDFIYFDKGSFEADLQLTFEHNASAVTEKGLFRAGTPRLFRVQFAGSALGTPGTYTTKLLRLDMAALYTEWAQLDNRDGNSIYSVRARVGYDETEAAAMTITVVNELAAVP
jgi:hypothetical protein